MSVMIKGGDRAFGCQLLDEASTQLPGPAAPPHILTPMVHADTGAKLSKYLIRESRVPPPPGIKRWMLDATAREGDTDSLVDAMLWPVGRKMSDPKHHYRSYTTKELDRLMAIRPATVPGIRAREMNLHRHYQRSTVGAVGRC